MFRWIIGLFFRRRHYWRGVSFDEIAELYMSRLLTIFALNIIGLFAALYLYKLGYSIIFIGLFYSALFAFKILITPLVAKYIAYYGPKHAVLIANIMRIPSMVGILFAPQYGIWAVIVYGVFQQIAACLYAVGYMVDFSKVRQADHTGKELGTMQLIEKAARVVSPLVGGLIASQWGPSIVIVLSGVLFVASSLPLFKTMEPTVLKSKLRLRGFPWRLTAKSLVTQAQLGFDIIASGIVWTLFIAVVVFASYGDGVYAAFGILAAAGVLVSMVASWVFGRLTDKNEGSTLFTTGVVVNSVVHALQPFTATPAQVVGVNIANETATSAYILPWTRALFDIADTSGFRIAYLAIAQACSDFGSLLACLLLAGLVWLLGVLPGMQFFYVCAAFLGLLILVGRPYTK